MLVALYYAISYAKWCFFCSFFCTRFRSIFPKMHAYFSASFSDWQRQVPSTTMRTIKFVMALLFVLHASAKDITFPCVGTLRVFFDLCGLIFIRHRMPSSSFVLDLSFFLSNSLFVF